MIWVKEGIQGAEALAKLLNNLENDERYTEWEVYVEGIINANVWYTVIYESDELVDGIHSDSTGQLSS